MDALPGKEASCLNSKVGVIDRFFTGIMYDWAMVSVGSCGSHLNKKCTFGQALVVHHKMLLVGGIH